MRWAGIYLLRILGGRDEFYAAGKIPCGRAASYFLFSLRLLPPYTELSQQHASIIAERISAVVYTFGGHALGMSLQGRSSSTKGGRATAMRAKGRACPRTTCLPHPKGITRPRRTKALAGLLCVTANAASLLHYLG